MNNMIGRSCLLAGWLVSSASLVFAEPPARPEAPPAPEHMIKRLDRDGDGLISVDEFKLPKHGKARARQEAVDSDGDGNISREEMEAQVEEHAKRDKARAQARFKETDLDNNGVVTSQERLRSHFDRLDADGDGYLSEDEVSAAGGRRHKGRNNKAPEAP